MRPTRLLGLICDGCGQGFMSEGASRCGDCERAADPLICRECGTRMLQPVPKGLCGICDEDWVAVAA